MINLGIYFAKPKGDGKNEGSLSNIIKKQQKYIQTEILKKPKLDAKTIKNLKTYYKSLIYQENKTRDEFRNDVFLQEVANSMGFSDPYDAVLALTKRSLLGYANMTKTIDTINNDIQNHKISKSNGNNQKITKFQQFCEHLARDYKILQQFSNNQDAIRVGKSYFLIADLVEDIENLLFTYWYDTKNVTKQMATEADNLQTRIDATYRALKLSAAAQVFGPSLENAIQIAMSPNFLFNGATQEIKNFVDALAKEGKSIKSSRVAGKDQVYHRMTLQNTNNNTMKVINSLLENYNKNKKVYIHPNYKREIGTMSAVVDWTNPVYGKTDVQLVFDDDTEFNITAKNLLQAKNTNFQESDLGLFLSGSLLLDLYTNSLFRNSTWNIYKNQSRDQFLKLQNNLFDELKIAIFFEAIFGVGKEAGDEGTSLLVMNIKSAQDVLVIPILELYNQIRTIKKIPVVRGLDKIPKVLQRTDETVAENSLKTLVDILQLKVSVPSDESYFIGLFK